MKILERCITHLAKNAHFEETELLIVDNGSHDSTRDLVFNLRKLHRNLRYIPEPQIGLSQARNTGARSTNSEWLVYIDDDVIVPDDYFDKISKEIKRNKNFSCFGGPYYALFDYGKPPWLPEDFGNKKWPISKSGILTEGYLSGGNFVIRRTALFAVGGFPIHTGMIGEKIRYGEEDFVQDRLRELGYTVFFNPEIYVKHLVLPGKLKLAWHLKHAMASGYSQDYRSPYQNLYSIFRSIMGSLFLRLPYGIKQMIFNRSYYYQNLILDLLCPILFHFGKFQASLNAEYRNSV